MLALVAVVGLFSHAISRFDKMSGSYFLCHTKQALVTSPFARSWAHFQLLHTESTKPSKALKTDQYQKKSVHVTATGIRMEKGVAD